MASLSSLRRALGDLLERQAPPLPRDVALGRSTRFYRQYDLGAGEVGLSDVAAASRAYSGRVNPSGRVSVIWGSKEYNARPKTPAATRKALTLMRRVGAALEYDAEVYRPNAYTFQPTSFSRAHLYDKMMERMARKYGYAPTLRTRINKAARGGIRKLAQAAHARPDDFDLSPLPYEVLDALFEDTYKRKGFGAAVRGALADLASPGVPASLLLALQSERDDG